MIVSSMRRPKSSLKWSGLTLLSLAMVGTVVWVVFSVLHLVNAFKDFDRVYIPSQRELKLEKKRYTVYYEQEGAVEQVDPFSELDVNIRSLATKQLIPVNLYGSRFSYQSGSRSGRAIYSFKADRDGRYLISVSGSSTRGAAIVIGPTVGSFVGKISLAVGIAIFLFFGLGGLGAALLTRYDRLKH